MYGYSPLKNLKIKNFRNIGDVNIDFTESPIITLLGANEAGKTSVIKAFSMCALHTSPREQKDWIRDDTDMLGVEIDLADGTEIIRIKQDKGLNMYRIVYPDGRVWDTNKITDGLPAEVSRLMGLIEEPETGEYLHVRTYEDQLLFVVTPSSTNYKVMYNALKVEQLTKAIKKGNVEVNEYKSEIARNESSIETLDNQLRAIRTVDVEPLISVKDRLTQSLAILDKLEKVVALKKRVETCEEQIGAIALIDRFNLQPLNEMRASTLSNISRLLKLRSDKINERQMLSEVDALDEINTDKVVKLESLAKKIDGLEIKKKEAGELVNINSLTEISEVVVDQLNKVMAYKTRLDNITKVVEDRKELNSCSEIPDGHMTAVNTLYRVIGLCNAVKQKQETVGQLKNYINQVEVYLKQCGVACETCPKCGETVIFDIDKMEEIGGHGH